MNNKWPIINLIVTIVSLGGIYLVSSGVTGLQRIGEVSARTEFTNLTLPPGFIFSIWGLIYAGFLLFAIYSLIPRSQENSKFSQARWLITISISLNLVWILLVGFQQFILPYILQWCMMALALYMLFKVKRNPNLFRSFYEKMLFQAFVLYGGWLTVAMIPYTTDILLSVGWNGEPMSREFWAILIYVVAVIIIYFAFRSLRYSVYLLPLAWWYFHRYLRISIDK